MSIGPVDSSSTSVSSEKVPVSFICSSSCAFVVSDRPILVPITSTTQELSDLVRHLLVTEGEDVGEDVRFEFLFEIEADNKILIRNSLRTVLLEAGWTLERTVRLEYFQSSPEPQLQETIEHPDWIRCLTSNAQGTFASGCFDGKLRVFSRASEKIAEIDAHSLALNDCAFIASNRLITVSLDQTAHAFHQQESSNVFEASFDLSLPADENEALNVVAVSKRGDLLAVAGVDGKISVFSSRREEPTEDSFQQPASATAEPAKKRTRKAVTPEEPQIRKRRTRLVLEGAHSAPITALFFDRTEYKNSGFSLLFSASLDGTIRAWDLVEQSYAFMLSGETPITALIQHPVNAKMLISAHVDGNVRFWDLSEPLVSSSALLPSTYFAGNAKIVPKRLKNLHRGWITALAWSPRNENLFASAGHDGAVHIWDARCPNNATPTPQFTLKAGNGLRDGEGAKVLALNWSADGMLRFGGEDNKVYCYACK